MSAELPNQTLPLPTEAAEPLPFRVRASHEGRTSTFSIRPLEEVTLGTSSTADWSLADMRISRVHCCLRHGGDGLHVIDLGSTNGLRVNGVRVCEAWLSEGDTLQLGRTELSFLRFEATDLAPEVGIPGFVGASAPARVLVRQVRRLARSHVPVLIRGETGTGKELIAQALHTEGSRGRGAWVALNVAAIPAQLAESELFGHVAGAFTGATRARQGAFQLAHKGTLFLDEIGSLSLDIQAKLLRAVEAQVVRSVGGETEAAVDVRIVAATCEPLEPMVKDGRFRRDLFERLAVGRVTVPPLRERRADIPLIAKALLDRSEFHGRALSPGALAAVSRLSLTGNVRELRNILFRAALECDAKQIDAASIALAASEPVERAEPLQAEQIDDAIRRAGSVAAAARALGVPRRTLRGILARCALPQGEAGFSPGRVVKTPA